MQAMNAGLEDTAARHSTTSEAGNPEKPSLSEKWEMYSDFALA